MSQKNDIFLKIYVFFESTAKKLFTTLSIVIVFN